MLDSTPESEVHIKGDKRRQSRQVVRNWGRLRSGRLRSGLGSVALTLRGPLFLGEEFDGDMTASHLPVLCPGSFRGSDRRRLPY